MPAAAEEVRYSPNPIYITRIYISPIYITRILESVISVISVPVF